MKVYNQEKTKILNNNEYDLNIGYLVNDTLHIPEVKEVKEQGHYETITEYQNGGKDVKWVVDVAGVKYQPEKDEPILVYKKYTEKQLEEHRELTELEELETWFDTDYARKEQKLRRLHTLGLEYEGQSAYDVLIATYVDAEKVRARINELRAKYGLS